MNEQILSPESHNQVSAVYLRLRISLAVVKARILNGLRGVLFLLSAVAVVGQGSLFARTSKYQRYIDPLLKVDDFGIHYFDDGAADATVLFPASRGRPWEKPRDPVVELVQLGRKAFPLLIDCLDDGRTTSVEFDGNRSTAPMKVPVGYVCLDILMEITRGQPISEPNCSDDGLGACIHYGYYFRPDDYYNCVEGRHTCFLRPWVIVVQQNWRKQFLRRRLRFHNPYDDLAIDEYRELRTTHN